MTVHSIKEASKRKAKPPTREGWEAELQTDKYGRCRRSLANIALILSKHPDWQGVIAYDAFAEAVVSTQVPPVRESDRPQEHRAGTWTENDDARTAMWLTANYDIDPGLETVARAVASVATRNVIHPVKEYLQGLRWDANRRLNRLFTDYFGADGTPYTQAIGVRFMVSAVARVMKPGCKVDNLVVLEGPQGIGKSTAARILAKNPTWFSDTGVVLGDKDSYQSLRGVWLYELAELASVRAARDVERYKAFFSSPIDTYRPSYGRRNVQIPRQCVFIGTTNELEYLHDKSGNRRFWPIRCSHIDLEALKRDVDLLWAEAVARHDSGEVWHVDSLDLAEQCREQQAEREQVDPWVQFIAEWLALECPLIRNGLDDYERIEKEKGITTTEVLRGAIGVAKDRVDRAAETRAGQALRHLGWERRRVKRDGKLSWRYFEVPTEVGTSDSGGNS